MYIQNFSPINVRIIQKPEIRSHMPFFAETARESAVLSTLLGISLAEFLLLL